MQTRCSFLSQFATAMLWVSIAEKHGRRAVLCASLVGNGLTVVAFGTSQNLGTAICTRLAMGLFNGESGLHVAHSVPNAALRFCTVKRRRCWRGAQCCARCHGRDESFHGVHREFSGLLFTVGRSANSANTRFSVCSGAWAASSARSWAERSNTP